MSLSFILACKKEENKVKIKQNFVKVCDSTKGYFVEYPAIIKEDYLEIESNPFYHFTLNKVLTKDETTYRLESYNSDGGSFNIEIPIELGIALGNIYLEKNIDNQFEKEFGKTQGLKCVVKFFNGNAPTRWNYEYSVKSDNKITLKNIYFYSPIPKMIYQKGVKDTVGHFIKFPINENSNKIEKEKIYSINNFKNWEKIEKTEKWILE